MFSTILWDEIPPTDDHQYWDSVAFPHILYDFIRCNCSVWNNFAPLRTFTCDDCAALRPCFTALHELQHYLLFSINWNVFCNLTLKHRKRSFTIYLRTSMPFGHTVQSSGTLCKVRVHCAKFGYTVQSLGTLCKVGHTVQSSDTLCKVRVHCAKFGHTVQSSGTLCKVRVHCAKFGHTVQSSGTLCKVRAHCAKFGHTVQKQCKFPGKCLRWRGQ